VVTGPLKREISLLKISLEGFTITEKLGDLIRMKPRVLNGSSVRLLRGMSMRNISMVSSTIPLCSVKRMKLRGSNVYCVSL